MPAAERLEVGAVRQRDLDAHEHVARACDGIGDLVDPDVAGAVPAQRPHGVKTTFSAAPLR